MIRTMRGILIKELRELWRDPLSLSLALFLPLALLFLFTYGLNVDVQPVRLGILDLDGSSASREYLTSLSASGDLRVVAWATSTGELREALDRGRIDIGMIFPPDFQRQLLEGETGWVQLLVDASYPPQARAALAQLDAAAAFYTQRLHRELAGAAVAGPTVIPESRVWFNPELKSVNFVVPGLFSIILMTFVPLLSTLAIVRERERGSIQQVLAAPVSPVAFILGKALPYGILAFVDLLIIFVVGLLWFKIPFRGSVPFFFLSGTAYVFAAVGVGLLISTVTRNQVVAMLLAIAVSIMPAFLFSGFLFPLYSMPEGYQWASLAFPARYFTEITRGLALKGSGPEELWPQFGALLALAVALLFLATKRFHRRMG